MRTRCLLLGGSGFLGRHVRARLVGAGVDTVTVARDGPGCDIRLDLAVADPAGLAALIRATAATVIVNCAGATTASPGELVAGNVVTVATVVEALRQAGGGVRLVHVGSAAEYGPGPVGQPVDETRPAAPVGPYGVTKLAGTALVLAAATHGLPATVLRVFNLIGPGTPTVLLPGRLVAELLAAPAAGRPARVGSLDGARDFVDVRDAAAAVAAATVPGVPPLLNVGSGRATPLRTLAAMLATVARSGPVEESRNGAGTAAVRRSGGVTWQQADIRAATAALAWRPTIDLSTSVADMWQAAAGRVDRRERAGRARGRP